MALWWTWPVFEVAVLGMAFVGAWLVAVLVALVPFCSHCLQTLAMSFLPPSTGFPARCQLQRDPLPSGACR